MERIVDLIGEPALLEQLAEECAELGQAALKLARKKRNENPTPKTEPDLLDNLVEEVADVGLCLSSIQEAGLIEAYKIVDTQIMKEDRWRKRIENKEVQL